MLFKVLLAGMCSLCLVGTATHASAHEFIVKPDKTQAAKGESVGVQAQAISPPAVRMRTFPPARTRISRTLPSCCCISARPTGLGMQPVKKLMVSCQVMCLSSDHSNKIRPMAR